MINRKLGITAFAGLFVATILFALRWYNIVNPRQESIYRLFNLLFFLASVLVFSTSMIFFAHWIFQVTRKLAMGFEYSFICRII